jgi:hypothetical protein
VLFRSNNLLWLVYGDSTPKATPPASTPSAQVSAVTQEAGAAAGELDLTFDFSGTPAALSRVQIMITGGSSSPNRTPAASEFRYVNYGLSSAGAITLDSLTPGAWYGVAIRYVDLVGQPTGYVTGYFQAASL